MQDRGTVWIVVYMHLSLLPYVMSSRAAAIPSLPRSLSAPAWEDENGSSRGSGRGNVFFHVFKGRHLGMQWTVVWKESGRLGEWPAAVRLQLTRPALS